LGQGTSLRLDLDRAADLILQLGDAVPWVHVTALAVEDEFSGIEASAAGLDSVNPPLGAVYAVA
jgi:hypothetical protein